MWRQAHRKNLKVQFSTFAGGISDLKVAINELLLPKG